jgi:NADH-quinone oxidoreductase subunit M
MILLATIVTLAAVWFTGAIEKYENRFYACLLFIAGAAIGAFASIDLFFFYAFHELALIPTFLLIGIWGSGNRVAAAWKITIYLAIGSFILLLGLILLYQSFPVAERSFDIRALNAAASLGQISADAQRHVYLLLLIGFGILVSLFPFHTWAPEAYASAPAPAAMLHAGVLKKFGLYGLLRLSIPLLPEGTHHWANLLVVLLLGNIIYVGLVTIAQKRLDWMLGYSSVMHMGYIFLGIASATILSTTGAVVLMFAHGLSIALLFGLAGELRKQTGTLVFDELGGLGKVMPFASLAFGCDRPAWSCELCRGNHDLFWCVQERLGDGSLSHLPNRDGACALGRGDLHGLYAAGLSQDIHGHDERAMERDCRSSSRIASPCRISRWRTSLLWIFSAISCANGNTRPAHSSYHRPPS